MYWCSRWSARSRTLGGVNVDPEKVLAAVTRNPKAAAQALAKYEAERSLLSFTRLMWKVVEPAQPLRVGWALGAIAEHLQAVSTGQIRNLLINVPPGFSKSMETDGMWPAFEWGPMNRPDLRVLSWSYTEMVVTINAARARTIVTSPLYQALWGDRVRLKKGQNAKLFFETTSGGFKLSSTIGGAGTGLRGDRLIVDDPHSVDGADSEAELQNTLDWFNGTLASRVRNGNTVPERIEGQLVMPSSTVVIMQRLGRRDVSGLILDNDLPFEHLLIEQEYEGTAHPRRRMFNWRPSSIGYKDPREKMIQAIDAYGASRERLRARRSFRVASYREPPTEELEREDQWWSSWERLWIAIARDKATLADPLRFPRSTVEEHKQRLRLKSGSNAVAAQFRQWPFEGEGLLFKREHFRFVDPHEVPLGSRPDVRGWDLAATERAGADATACVKLRMSADGRIFVLDAREKRVSPAGVDDFIREMHALDGPTVTQDFPQDPGGTGKMIVHHIARLVIPGAVIRSSPERKDKQRRAEPFASQVEHGNVYIVRGTWNEAYLRYLVDFPHGLHDDLVDATARAYSRIIIAQTVGEPTAPKLFTSNGPG